MSADADIDAMLATALGGGAVQTSAQPAGDTVAAFHSAEAGHRERPVLVPAPKPVAAKPLAEDTLEMWLRVKAPAATPAPQLEREAAVERLSRELADQIDESNEAPPLIVDPRSLPVRFSRLKHIALSPLHYWDACQADRDDTLAMRLGRGTHALVLGEPVVCYPGRRVGKAWERFERDHEGVEILNEREWDIAAGISRNILRHPIAAELLLGEGVIREQTIEWEWMGRAWTSRPDARRGGKIVTDLKTTRCAEPSRFQRDATSMGYPAQLACYGMAVAYLTGEEPDDLYVVAVESKRPYAVTVLRLEDETRLAGMQQCRLWFERLLQCEAADEWPAYTDAVVAFGTRDSAPDPNPIDVDALDADPFA